MDLSRHQKLQRAAGFFLGLAVLCGSQAQALEAVHVSEENVSFKVYDSAASGQAVALQGSEAEVVVDGVRYQLQDTSASIVGYTVEIPENCTIPGTITADGGQYTVTAIGESGFYNCSQLRSISLPGTLERIGTSAFNGCTGLSEITIPASVTELGSSGNETLTEFDLFRDCSALTAIHVEEANQNYASRDGVLFDSAFETLYCYPMGRSATQYEAPEGTVRISSYAFYRADRLTDVTLPDTVTEIGQEAFSDCTALEHIDLGAGLQTVGWGAFNWCSRLEGLAFPAALQELDGYQYRWTNSLTAYEVAPGCARYYSQDGVLFERLTEGGVLLWGYPAARAEQAYAVPSEVTVLGEMAFDSAVNLRSVTFMPDSQLGRIESGAFSLCSGITELALPDTVTKLGSYVLQNCENLTNIDLGDGVTALEDSLFHNCARLTEVTIPKSVARINASAFRECTAIRRFLVSEENTNFYAADGVLYSSGADQRLVAYPAGRPEATLTIPAGVTDISVGCFSASSDLEEIRVEAGSQFFYAEDGVLFQFGTDGDLLHTYPGGKLDVSYTVPDGVTAIADMAFYGNGHLTFLDVNGTVTIGTDAFSNAALTGIRMPAVRELGDFAFLASDLKTVQFPESLKNIGGQALDFCHDLEYIEFHGTTPPQGRSDLCYESEGLRYVYVPEGCQAAYKAFFANGIYPGAMIVEGAYRSSETVEELIGGLTDASDAQAVHEAATAVVRLTSEDAAKLTDAELLKVEDLFQKANPSLQITTDDRVAATAVTVEGAALASGLVEESAAGAVAGSVSVEVAEGTLLEGELLNLEFGMTVDGQEKQLQAPVVVTVTMTEEMARAADRNELRLIHRDGWEEEPVEYTIRDGEVTFRAASFSSYVFLQDAQTPEGVQRVYYATSGAATLYLAGYDAAGRMVSLQEAEVTGSGAQDFQRAEGAAFRVFLLDPMQRPVGSVELSE